MASTTYDLQRRLRPIQRRLRLRDTLQLAQRTAWFPGTGFVLMQAIGRIVPIANLLIWSLAPLVVWAPALAIYLIIHRLSPTTAARRADLLLELRERFSTALA